MEWAPEISSLGYLFSNAKFKKMLFLFFVL